MPVSARTSVVLPWSMCPAVPTVSGTRARAARAATDDGRHLVRLGVVERAAVEQRAAVADDADDRRLALAQRRRERLLDRAREARQLGERQRAAADARDRLLDLAADRRREPLGAGAHVLGDGLAQHPQHRDLAGHAPARGERERPLERGERELVGAERALERMAAQTLDEVGPAGDDPRLRPAEQLVAREADEVGAGRERRRDGRLALEVGQRAGAEVVDEREAVRGARRRRARVSDGCSVKPTIR